MCVLKIKSAQTLLVIPYKGIVEQLGEYLDKQNILPTVLQYIYKE